MWALSEDTIEGFDAYLTACFEGLEGLEKPELRQALAQKAGESTDWLADLGVNFKMCGASVSNVDYYADVTPAVARVHMAEGGGAAWSGAMHSAAVDAGAEFAFDAQVTKLVTDPSGAVMGVEALQEGGPVRAQGRDPEQRRLHPQLPDGARLPDAAVSGDAGHPDPLLRLPLAAGQRHPHGPGRWRQAHQHSPSGVPSSGQAQLT